MQQPKKRPFIEEIVNEEASFARILWSNGRHRKRDSDEALNPQKTCVSALTVFSTKDLVIGCLIPLLDQFEDILALSRICGATRSILARHCREFAAFRLVLAPFGRSYSIDEWNRRAAPIIGNHGALRLYYYMTVRYALPMESVLLHALSHGTLLGREEALHFCEQIVNEHVALGLCGKTYDAEKEKRRAALAFCRGPDDAIEIHKRLLSHWKFVSASHMVSSAIRAAVPVEVFLYFADITRAEYSLYQGGDVPCRTEIAFLCKKALYGRSVEIMECVINRFDKMLVITSVRKYLFKHAREKKHAIAPEMLDLLVARDIITFNDASEFGRPALDTVRALLAALVRVNDPNARAALAREHDWWHAKIKALGWSVKK